MLVIRNFWLAVRFSRCVIGEKISSIISLSCSSAMLAAWRGLPGFTLIVACAMASPALAAIIISRKSNLGAFIIGLLWSCMVKFEVTQAAGLRSLRYPG